MQKSAKKGRYISRILQFWDISSYVTMPKGIAIKKLNLPSSPELKKLPFGNLQGNFFLNYKFYYFWTTYFCKRKKKGVQK